MIYLHVGKPKTGTTTIQRSLINNRIPLLKQQVLYPQAGIMHWGHHNVYYELAKSPLYDESLGSFELLKKNIFDYKKKFPNGNIILSSETFSGAFVRILERLVNPLKELDEVQVLIYYRKQEEYIRSFWSMQLKQEKVNNGFKVWALESIETNRYGCDYLWHLERFERVLKPEEIKIISYNDIEPTNFTQHFFELCQVQLTPEFILPEVKYNASKWAQLKIPEEVTQLCQERFAASNRAIAEKYLNRDYLFE